MNHFRIYKGKEPFPSWEWWPWVMRTRKLKRGLIHQPLFKIPRLVPELGGLGYFVKYSSPPSSSTKLGKLGWWANGSLPFLFTQLGTRAHQARVPSWANWVHGLIWLSSIFYLPSLVPELDALGYFVKYPSPPSSGTKLGHRVPHGLCGPLNY